MWEKLALNANEEDEMEIKEDWSSMLRGQGHLCVTVKVISDHRFNRDALKQTLRSIWRISKGMVFKDAPDNMLLVEFFDAGDKERVLIGRPWSFDMCLLLVTPLDGDVQPSKLEMNLVPFWVQIHDLPFLYMNRDVGEKVGWTLGMVFMVDTDVKGVGWGKSLRVRVQIDVTQPLLRGKKLRLGGNSVWVYFKYERLPLFCYGCGRIWHGGGGCPAHAQMRGRCTEVAQYGPWLRALDDSNSGSRGAPAKGVVGDDIIEHQEDEAERMADTDGGWNSNRKIDHSQASSSTRFRKDGRVSAIGSVSARSIRDGLGDRGMPVPSGLLKTVPLIKSSGPRIELEKDQAGSSLGGDEVGLTQVESLPNSIQAQHSTSSADKSGSLKKPTKYQKRSQRALSSTRGKKTKGTTSGRRVLEGKKNSGFKRSQVLKTNPITQGFRRKRFRFEAMWLTHAQCKDQVELAWGSAIEGDPLAQVTRKIKDCKTNLMAWDKDVFGNVTRKIKVESKKLEALERLPAGELVEEQICCLKKELNALLGKEEIMWRQRSKVQWLREGDRNTKFFHVRANQRKRRNGMEGLFYHNGQWVTGQKDIAQVTVQYFHSIFSTSHPSDAEMSAVLDQTNGVIHYPLEGLPQEAMVADLIDPGRGVWKEEVVRRCFSLLDVASILQYPLLPSLPKDALTWWGTPSGKFSVKSAYHTAFLKVQIQGNPESSNSKELQLFWKAVWALKLP
ncbi:putative ribonuclease h protein [Fagus crenata]